MNDTDFDRLPDHIKIALVASFGEVVSSCTQHRVTRCTTEVYLAVGEEAFFPDLKRLCQHTNFIKIVPETTTTADGTTVALLKLVFWSFHIQ